MNRDTRRNPAWPAATTVDQCPISTIYGMNTEYKRQIGCLPCLTVGQAASAWRCCRQQWPTPCGDVFGAVEERPYVCDPQMCLGAPIWHLAQEGNADSRVKDGLPVKENRQGLPFFRQPSLYGMPGAFTAGKAGKAPGIGRGTFLHKFAVRVAMLPGEPFAEMPAMTERSGTSWRDGRREIQQFQHKYRRDRH